MYDNMLFVGGKNSGLSVIGQSGVMDSLPLSRAVSASGKSLGASDLIAMLHGSRIRSIVRDSKDRLWIATFGENALLRYEKGTVIRFSTEDGLPSDRVRTVFEMSDGKFAVACSGGVAMIDNDIVTDVYNEDNRIGNTEILTVCEGLNNDIIVGTDGGGIYVISNGNAVNIDLDGGLSSEVVMRIKKDSSRNLFWLVTSNSIAYLDDSYVQYLYGLELIKKWNYQKAIDIFTELDDYNDSKNLISQCYYKLGLQLLGKKAYEEAVVCFKTSGDSDRSQKRIKECYYNLGLQLLDKKNYEEAIEFFRLSGDYSDSEKRIKECYYNIGLQLLEEQSYSDAIEAFEKGGDFSDSKKRVKECYYNIGLQLLSEKSYDGAIAAFKKAGDFSDSKEKINAAKYAYVTEHKNNTDATTYKYLKELTSANYKDSKKIYTSLYAWKLTDIVFNTHRDDTSSNYTSFDKYDTIYFHASVSGGPPDGKTHIYCSIDWPDGSFTEKERLNTLFKAGDSLQLSFEQIYSDGPLYLEIFDDAGNLMGKGSVDVT